MTERSEFSLHLTFCRELWNEINQVSPIDNLEKCWQTLPDSTKKVLESKLLRLHSHLEEIKRIEEQRISEGDVPWQEAGEGLAEFYREKIRPRFDELQSLWLVGWWIDLDLGKIEPSLPDASASNDIASFIQAAVRRCEGLWEQFPEGDTVFTEYAFEQASKLVAAKLFCPDQWLENLEDVKPIVSSKNVSKMPSHIRFRLTEIYRSFIFGNWLAVKSLSRSLLEYEILDRSGSLEIAAREDNGYTKDIGRLVQLVTDKIPALKEVMELVVDHGNRVMHPKKREIHPINRVREEALDCVRAIQGITERLYQ